MIARVSGKLVSAEVTEAVVDVHGVGYAVTIPLSTYDKLPAPGGEVTLLTHLHVREDVMQLFGFISDEERRLFRLLMTVNGIGPKLALNVLSCMPAAAFCSAVALADIKALSKISGVGKRTAERLVLELKEKVAEIAPAAGIGGGAAAAAGRPATGISSPEAKDAMSGLGTLGFKPEQAQKVVAQLCAELPEKEQTAANLIRQALKRLNA